MENYNCRYTRNIGVAAIGEEGQRRLRSGRVFVLGCGALGSVVAAYLTGAGVGSLTIADFDTISLSNLQRQVFYRTDQCGQSKLHTLAAHLRALNPEVDLHTVERRVECADLEALLDGVDLMVDASDNPQTKYMTDSVCRRLGVPYVLGGVSGMQGQVLTWLPGYPGYSDFFPDGDMAAGAPKGVLGPTPGTVASVQCAEALKYLAGIREGLLSGRLLLIDLLSMRFNEIKFDNFSKPECK